MPDKPRESKRRTDGEPGEAELVALAEAGDHVAAWKLLKIVRESLRDRKLASEIVCAYFVRCLDRVELDPRWVPVPETVPMEPDESGVPRSYAPPLAWYRWVRAFDRPVFADAHKALNLVPPRKRPRLGKLPRQVVQALVREAKVHLSSLDSLDNSEVPELGQAERDLGFVVKLTPEALAARVLGVSEETVRRHLEPEGRDREDEDPTEEEGEVRQKRRKRQRPPPSSL